MTNDFDQLTHAEMRAVYEQNLKDFKELQRKAQVVKILEEMNVPETRKDLNKLSNLQWLQRNLLIQNGNHPRVTEALETIKVLAREKSKQIQQLTKLPTM